MDGQQRYRAVWTHDVRIENDTVVEADETLVLQLGPHYSIGPPAFHTVHDGVDPVQATVTIIDNDPPVDFTADPTPNSVVLTWGHGIPADDLTVHELAGHEYRQRTGTAGTWGDWMPISSSGTGGINYEKYTVPSLATGVTYGFELRAVDGSARGVAASAEATTFEPMSVALCCNSPTTFTLGERPRLTFKFSHRVGTLDYFDEPVDYTGVFVDTSNALDPAWGRNLEAGESGRFWNLDITPTTVSTVTVTLQGSDIPRTRCTQEDRDNKTRFCSSPDNLPLGESLVVTLTQRTTENNATLSGLVVNDGTTDLALTPTFASAVTSYTASVANAVDEVTVTPTKATGATVAYLDASDDELVDADTAAGQQVALAVGANVIKVQVTSADGTMTQTYTVTVRRAAALPELSVDDGRGRSRARRWNSRWR